MQILKQYNKIISNYNKNYIQKIENYDKILLKKDILFDSTIFYKKTTNQQFLIDLNNINIFFPVEKTKNIKNKRLIYLLRNNNLDEIIIKKNFFKENSKIVEYYLNFFNNLFLNTNIIKGRLLHYKSNKKFCIISYGLIFKLKRNEFIKRKYRYKPKFYKTIQHYSKIFKFKILRFHIIRLTKNNFILSRNKYKHDLIETFFF